MTTGMTLTEVHLPAKDTGFSSTGSRFLSKIARSPTSARRHKPGLSQGSDTFPETLPSTASQTQGAVNSRRNQPRPGFQRQISAPDTSVLRRAPVVVSEPKHHSDASEETGKQARDMLQRQPTNANAYPLHSHNAASGKGIAQANMFSAPLVSEYYTASNGGSVAQTAQIAVNSMYQQVYELSQKRIVTLKYMRQA